MSENFENEECHERTDVATAKFRRRERLGEKFDDEKYHERANIITVRDEKSECLTRNLRIENIMSEHILPS